MDKVDILNSIYRYLVSIGAIKTHQDIADALKASKSSISSAFNGNERYLTQKLLFRINNAFGQIFNEDWLMNGVGEMLKLEISSNTKPISDIQFLNIPFVPIYAQAGYGRGYGDQEYIDNLPTLPVIVDKNYRGKYRVFEVDGDSMDNGTRNSIYDGDKILCREVRRELWTSKLHIKDWYFVICMKNDGITVKQITSHDVESGRIVCHSLNTLFEDFEVNLRDVAELYNVIKIVDRITRI